MATMITDLTDDEITTTGRVKGGSPRLAADPDTSDATDTGDDADSSDATDDADVDGTDASDGDTTDA